MLSRWAISHIEAASPVSSIRSQRWPRASASCSGPTAESGSGASDKLPPQVLDPSEVSETVAPLPGVGARCRGGMCECREVDAAGRGQPETDEETSPVPAGHKRYELRTGRGDDTMRITVEGVGTFAAVNKVGLNSTVIVTVDPTNGKVTGELAVTNGYNSVYGLAGWEGLILAFDSSSQMIKIDPVTKVVTNLGAKGVSWWGAGVGTLIPQ